METAWFVLLALMLATYVVLDGFDLGAGAVHLFAARDEGERDRVLRSIGPVWDGNEVWLVAAGGVLFMAFPRLYATSFSGFYLPLIIVLWLLMLRGLSIELRGHVDDALWRRGWDSLFALSSLTLAVVLGAAVGNVVRGVPIGEDGTFFAPLWTDFTVGPTPGVLDWYTVTVGLLAAAALSMHGALWVAHKTMGPLRERSARLAGRALWAAAALVVAVSVATFAIQPLVPASFAARPWGVALPAGAAAALGAVVVLLRRGQVGRAFLASAAFLALLLGSAAFGLYPVVLPAVDGARSLTIHNASTTPHGLWVGLAWIIPGMALAIGYFVNLYRRFAAPEEAPE